MLRTWPRKRIVILILAGVLLAALLLLAASLSRMDFKPGLFLSFAPRERPEGGTVYTVNLDWFWQAFMWALLAFLPLSVIAALIWPRSFKYALLRAVALSITLILTYYFIRVFKDLIERLLAALHRLTSQADLEGVPSVADQLTPGAVQVPGWSIFPFLLLILALSALLVWRITRWVRAGRETPALEAEELTELAAIAGAAVSRLRAGQQLHDVIMRCYREMSELLAERKHIPPAKRPVLTPREFEERLRNLGVRDEHVHRLTELFERVRYGGHRASAAEEREAERALAEIEQIYGKPVRETS